MRGFNKKLFLIYLLLSQGVAKANWQSLYEEFEEFESVNTIQPVNNSGVPIEIIRNDIDDTASEQLNLF